jgi:hypothetical protein
MSREEKVELKILKEYLRKGLAYYSGCYSSEEYVIKTLKDKFKYTDRQVNNLKED